MDARRLSSSSPTIPHKPFENQLHPMETRHMSPLPPTTPPHNPFESQLRRVSERRPSPPRSPPAPRPRPRPASPRIGSGRCRVDMSKARDYYLDIEAMKTNVATVNAPPTTDDNDIRNVQQWKRIRVFFEQYLTWQFQRRCNLLRKLIKEAKEKERAQATTSQRAEPRPMPSPRHLDDRVRNGLCPSTYTFDAQTLSQINEPPHALNQYTADEFVYDSVLCRTRQIQAQDNPPVPSDYPNYSQLNSARTPISKSRDISPPAHLLPSDLFSESPPPPMISEAITRQTNALTYEDLCQDLEPVDESTLKKACEIFNLATNIKKFPEKYKSTKPADDVPLDDIRPIVAQESKSSDEKHNDELPFKLFNEIFEPAEYTQDYQVTDNQYITPLNLSLESSYSRDNRMELTPLTLECNQYDIPDNQVQQNTYITPVTPSLSLESNFAITREPTHTPLQGTPRSQPTFTSLNINVTSAQTPQAQETPHESSSITFMSAQLLPYELFCKEFVTQHTTDDTLEYEASYSAGDIDYVSQYHSHTEMSRDIKSDEKVVKDTADRINKSVKQRKWSLLPYWACDNIENETKAVVEPSDQLSFKEIEEEINALTISEETIDIPEIQSELDDINDWAEISPIWSYRKEDKTIKNENQEYKEPNELLPLSVREEDECKKSENQNIPDIEFQFLLIPSDKVKDNTQRSVVSPDTVEQVQKNASQQVEKDNKAFDKLTCDNKNKTVHQHWPTINVYESLNKATEKSSERGTKDSIKIKPTKSSINSRDSKETDMLKKLSKDAKSSIKKQSEKQSMQKITKISKNDKKSFTKGVNPNKPDDKVDPNVKSSRKAKEEVATKGRRKSKHMKNTKVRKSKKK